MNLLKKFILSSYFNYLIIFLIVFCLSSVLLLDSNHPLYMASFIGAPIIFILQRYRKYLMKASDKKV